MQVTCRRQDTKRFDDLGFTEQDPYGDPPKGDPSPIVEMVDQEANYAHYEEMPTDIPYYGFNGAGDNYGASVFACDGKQYAEAGGDGDGSFVVDWSETNDLPTDDSLDRIRTYRRVLSAVREMFGENL